MLVRRLINAFLIAAVTCLGAKVTDLVWKVTFAENGKLSTPPKASIQAPSGGAVATFRERWEGLAQRRDPESRGRWWHLSEPFSPNARQTLTHR